MRKVYTNGIIYTGKEIFSDVAILCNEGKVLGFVYNSDIPSDYEEHDLDGNNIAPAFIDLQIYGGNDHLFSADPSIKAIEATSDYCLSGGCTRLLLTMATNDRAVYSKGIEVVKQYFASGGKNLLGLHIEGPWLSPDKRGAHCLEFIHSPTMDEVKEFIDEAAGVVKMITLAPEMVEPAIIDLIQSNNIIVAAGHTNATYNQATESFNKIKTVTHLFNAMSPYHGREPGMVGAIYDHPTIKSSVVADGIHVDFASIRISKRILGDRLYLITDAVAETHTGPYQHIFRKDRYVIPDGTLSGSSLTMMKAVQNCVEFIDIPLEEALRMASLYPARIAGVDDQFGIIEKNRSASFVVFDQSFNVKSVIDGS